MAKVEVKQTIKAPIEKVFASWNDFGNIYKFHPGLRHSRLINHSKQGGLNAQRQCELKDGKNWLRERVVDFENNRRMVIDIYDSSMPIKSAKATIQFESKGMGTTEVHFTMDFVPGMGIIGTLMLPMMKMQFKSLIQQMLKSNGEYVEQGKQVERAMAAA